MDYITFHRETGLLICKDCKFALIPSRINRHFSKNPHKLKPQTRSEIENYISQLNSNNLITSDSEIRPIIERFLNSFNQTPIIPDLAIYSDGLSCSYCSYISRSRRPIQDYYREIHNWENPRVRGRKKKSKNDDPWEHNVSCQQFFKSGPGKQFFRVYSIRASPSRIPIRPRIEISRTRESSSSENDQDQDDSDLLDPKSQG